MGNLAQGLFAGPPIHTLGAPIPKANRSIPIERENAIVRHVEQLSLLAEAFRAFACFAGRPRRLQGALFDAFFEIVRGLDQFGLPPPQTGAESADQY